MNFKKILLSTSRLNKKLLALVADFISLCFSIVLALYVSEIDFSSLYINQIFGLFWMPVLCLATFWYFGVYRSVLRYIDLSVILILAKAISVVLIFGLIGHFLFVDVFSYLMLVSHTSINFEGWLLGCITFSFLILTSRITAHFYLSDRVSETRIVIYGAGSAGIQLASALQVSKEMQPVAFLDKNPSLQGSYLGGVKVLHPKKLEKLAKRGQVDEVLIAMPSASKSTLRALLREIEEFSIKVRILPGVAALAQGEVSVSELKEVDISDLLGRQEVEPDNVLIKKNIENKSVLITGAGGSIGSELSRQVIKNNPKQLILLDSSEYALYSIKKEIEDCHISADLYAVLANVNNKKRMTEVCKTFKVNTIYHAAAYKHVPLVEENPFEAVLNNIHGTKACAEAAVESKVDTFVLISTDKAVRPTNIMGATKRFSELILQSMAPEVSTRMMMVRFGNVIGSSGSAIPLFQQQIKDGGPVTVTHPEVTRYFMSIPEAAELVIQAGAMGEGGDVFVLDMGEPVKIYDLAKRLINLSGMELKDKKNPEGDIEIIFTGLRPGEKLYEELLIGHNISTTRHKQILRAEEDYLSMNELDEFFKLLNYAEREGDVKALRDIMKKVVSGFIPEDEIVDVIYIKKNK